MGRKFYQPRKCNDPVVLELEKELNQSYSYLPGWTYEDREKWHQQFSDQARILADRLEDLGYPTEAAKTRRVAARRATYVDQIGERTEKIHYLLVNQDTGKVMDCGNQPGNTLSRLLSPQQKQGRYRLVTRETVIRTVEVVDIYWDETENIWKPKGD